MAARIVAPHTKLATEDDLYRSMDWLLDHQEMIETKLAGHPLENGALALYDLSFGYFVGKTCPLAAIGHRRDGKRGKLQLNRGLLTDRRGNPLAVSVQEGNTGNAYTLMPQVEKLEKDFGLERVLLVGQIRRLVEGAALQLGKCDKRNLLDLTQPDYPGERLMACRNVELGKLRAHKRQSLLEATTKELEKIRAMVGRGYLLGAGRIGIRAGRVVDKYEVSKHFDLSIDDDRFAFMLGEDDVPAEAALDGIHAIRTATRRAG